MILYHGTSEAALEAILDEGIQPRKHTGAASNYPGQSESKAGFVYLSTAYPLFFAEAAVGETDQSSVIIQVDAHGLELYPDEDFIAFALAGKNATKESLRRLISEVDPADYQHAWVDGLSYNGTACARKVTEDRIRGHRVVPGDDLELQLALGWDALVTPISYRFLGARYERALAAFFDGGRESALSVSRDRPHAFAMKW